MLQASIQKLYIRSPRSNSTGLGHDMLRPLLVLVFVLKHVFAERIRPSPDPIYKPPVTQDIFRVTNGTPGVSSVAKLPLLGRLGTRQVRSSRCHIFKGTYKLYSTAWTDEYMH